MDPLSWPFWQAVGMSVLCGGIIGVDRELHDKPAGLRTCILVSLGSMLFVRLGSQLDGPAADPTRVLGQVITGIGFLGAGVILARGHSVRGVTTAGTVWVLAAIGAMIGLDQHSAAFAVTAVVSLVLVLLGPISNRLSAKTAEHHPDDTVNRPPGS
ncbi:MAG: MgtC/SapB family protein [Planctomycetaceae bacterium]